MHEHWNSACQFQQAAPTQALCTCPNHPDPCLPDLVLEAQAHRHYVLALCCLEKLLQVMALLATNLQGRTGDHNKAWMPCARRLSVHLPLHGPGPAV